MSYETLIVEQTEGVTLIRLNRPEALNALNSQLLAELCTALDAAEADKAVRCVVLTGSDRAFAAGADIKELKDKTFAEVFEENLITATWEGISRLRKPVIAAVSGHAIGGGCELALMCDLIVAAENAQFGLPEVKVGLFAAAGGAFRIVKQLPPKLAMEHLLTGDPFDAATALRYGFANRVVPLAELMPTAIALAEKIAGNAPLSVQASKRVALRMQDGAIAGDDAHWADNSRERRVLMASEDAREGPRAFAEKRKPVWKAR